MPSKLLHFCSNALAVDVDTLSRAQENVMRTATLTSHAPGIPWGLAPVAMDLLSLMRCVFERRGLMLE